MGTLPPRSPRRTRLASPPERRISALGRPLPRAVTWLLLAAGIGVSVALALPEPWRTRILSGAVALFAVVAVWRLSASLPGSRER